MSSFYETPAGSSPEDEPVAQESEAVLATVRAYVRRAAPEAREGFLADLRAIIEATAACSTSGSVPEDPQDI